MFTALTSISRMFSVVAQTQIFLVFALVSILIGNAYVLHARCWLTQLVVNLDVFCFGFVSTQTPALERNCEHNGFVCSSLLSVSKPQGQAYRPLLFLDLFSRTEFCRNTDHKCNYPNSPCVFDLFIPDVTRSSSCKRFNVLKVIL